MRKLSSVRSAKSKKGPLALVSSLSLVGLLCMVVTLYCWNQPDKVVEAANRAEVQQQGNSSLNTFILNPLVLKSNKAQIAKNNLLKGALAVLLSQANKAMQVPLYSVMNKAKVLSSLPMIRVGNIHDYYSIAPYW